MPHATIGVIGGSGLYQMQSMTEVEEVRVSTPFGDPSDVITVGDVSGVSMAFLPRHGRGHRISPTEIPVRANIWALKSLGVEWIISVSAVGSLREDIAPRDLIIPDQLFDRTKSRVNSFFEGGIVVHCTFADPFCPTLSGLLLNSARELGDVKVHQGGAYVCMEGPLFSTRTYAPPWWTFTSPSSRAELSSNPLRVGQNGSAKVQWTTMPPSKKLLTRLLVRSKS